MTPPGQPQHSAQVTTSLKHVRSLTTSSKAEIDALAESICVVPTSCLSQESMPCDDLQSKIDGATSGKPALWHVVGETIFPMHSWCILQECRFLVFVCHLPISHQCLNLSPPVPRHRWRSIMLGDAKRRHPAMPRYPPAKAQLFLGYFEPHRHHFSESAPGSACEARALLLLSTGRRPSLVGWRPSLLGARSY